MEWLNKLDQVLDRTANNNSRISTNNTQVHSSHSAPDEGGKNNDNSHYNNSSNNNNDDNNESVLVVANEQLNKDEPLVKKNLVGKIPPPPPRPPPISSLYKNNKSSIHPTAIMNHNPTINMKKTTITKTPQKFPGMIVPILRERYSDDSSSWSGSDEEEDGDEGTNIHGSNHNDNSDNNSRTSLTSKEISFPPTITTPRSSSLKCDDHTSINVSPITPSHQHSITSTTTTTNQTTTKSSSMDIFNFTIPNTTSPSSSTASSSSRSNKVTNNIGFKHLPNTIPPPPLYQNDTIQNKSNNDNIDEYPIGNSNNCDDINTNNTQDSNSSLHHYLDNNNEKNKNHLDTTLKISNQTVMNEINHELNRNSIVTTTDNSPKIAIERMNDKSGCEPQLNTQYEPLQTTSIVDQKQQLQQQQNQNKKQKLKQNSITMEQTNIPQPSTNLSTTSIIVLDDNNDNDDDAIADVITMKSSSPLQNKIPPDLSYDDNNYDADDLRRLSSSTLSLKNKGSISELQAFHAAMGDVMLSNTILSYDDDDDDDDVSDDGPGDDTLTKAFNVDESILYWESEMPTAQGLKEDDHSSLLEQYSLSSAISIREGFNCHGIVHLRLLRAVNLNCSPGSAVHASISLRPWKGRIKSKNAISFQGPTGSGVCVRWDDDTVDDFGDLVDFSGISKTKKGECFSMVHAYNSEDTPFPFIIIELKDFALNIIEKEICTLTLSCEPIMKHPGTKRVRWCVADDPDMTSLSLSPSKQKETNQSRPMILLEASFEQTESDQEVDTNDGLHEIVNTVSFDPAFVRDRNDTLDSVDAYSLANLSMEKNSSTQAQKRLPLKPHMFRIVSNWIPVYCAVCSSMISWQRKGYQCEVCKIISCGDCLLRVDVDLPCGSDVTVDAVKKASLSRISVNKILAAIAPISIQKETDQNINIEKPDSVSSIAVKSVINDDVTVNKNDVGVGNFKLRILKACLFEKPFPADTELSDIMRKSDRRLRIGDHYVRISWTGSQESKRTKTVFQAAKPIFNSDEMSIIAMHYGIEFRIEVIEASTDKTVGSVLVSTQGLLQKQRDEIASNGGLTLSKLIHQAPLGGRPSKMILELRNSKGFGLDYFNNIAEITGWIEVEMNFEESLALYSWNKPSLCPERPPDDFNTDLIQLHVGRITAILEDFTKLLNAYFYMISWSNMTLTSLSLLMYVSVCLKFNTEYFGSLFVGIMIIYMLYLASLRQNGHFQKRWINKETDIRIQENKRTQVKYDRHRPCATLEICVAKGRNLLSSHGIPGSAIATISFDPVKYADEKVKKDISTCDSSVLCVHPIGETESPGINSNPDWTSIQESDELKHLKQLLPSSNFLSRTDAYKNDPNANAASINVVEKVKAWDGLPYLQFPILQPILPIETTEGNENGDQIPIDILPWQTSLGALVIQVRFVDVFNKLALFNEVLGDVVVPLSQLAQEKNHIEGWFKVLEHGTKETEQIQLDQNCLDIVTPSSSDGALLSRLTSPDDDENDSTTEKVDAEPMIYLKAKLKLPPSQVSNIDKETSLVVAEEMIRTASLSQNMSIGFIGTSINTLNTVRGVTSNLQSLQNQLGAVLDLIEMARNAFNFSCPEKSTFILICLIVLYIVLSIIPTRFVLLLAGLGQYAATFMVAFNKSANNNSTASETQLKEEKQADVDPYSAMLMNFFMSIPTDEDLRRYYYWEAKKAGEREKVILAKKRRSTRLSNLWKAQWYGLLEIKLPTRTGIGGDESTEWDTIFAIIQGHRFIWWKSEKSFDDGDNPSGQIFFSGHSGLAGLSPLDLRQLKKSEIPLVVSIFGRGLSGQQKISLLTPDISVKESLEYAVIGACTDCKID